MTKDLFALLFKQFSRWNYEEYYVSFVERLPYRFIQGAAAANPALNYCDGFGNLRELLRSQSSNRWKNPELYPHLNRIIIPNYAFLQKHIDALQIHVGLKPLSAISESLPRFWRLRDPIVKVIEITGNGEAKSHNLLTPARQDEVFPIIYKPHPNLFDDIQDTLYRGDGDYDVEVLKRLAYETLSLLRRYSPEIAAGFCREINTVAFMPRQRGEVKSFSMRNFYIGAIFVSITDPILLGEQFIHEYYHQVIWPWWMVEPPQDLPNDKLKITSPVTGRLRPVSVMIHAAVVYSSLIEFYRFVLSSECIAYDPDQISDARMRLTKIEGSITQLFANLKAVLQGHPRTREIVEVLSESLTAT